MISFLKRVWNLWSNLLTFEWLGRLHEKQPRLATAITGTLISLALGLFAWNYLDPRFRLYEKGSNIPMSWTFRYFMSGLLILLTAFTVVATALSVKTGGSISLEQLFGKKPKYAKRKQ